MKSIIITFGLLVLFGFQISYSPTIFSDIPVNEKRADMVKYIRENKSKFKIVKDQAVLIAHVDNKGKYKTDSSVVKIRKYKMTYYKHNTFDSIVEIEINHYYKDTIFLRQHHKEIEKELDKLYKARLETEIINSDHLNQTARKGLKYKTGSGQADFISLYDYDRFNKTKAITLTFSKVDN